MRYNVSILSEVSATLFTPIAGHIPSGVMVPQRRLETLLEQAKIYQRSQCRYHTSNPAISLYTDHVCDKTVFPTQTTHILGGHDDQVWRVQFSHNGRYLATTSKDGTSLVWQVTVSAVHSYIRALQC